MEDILEKTLEIAKRRDIPLAISFQEKLKDKVILSGTPILNKIVGFDAAYRKEKNKEFIISSCVLFERTDKTFDIKDKFYSIDEVIFPYIPGLFSFRESIGFINCWKKISQKLKTEIDLIFVNGHGIMHPRRVGLATHIGLIVDIPTIGCAKERLVGNAYIPENTKGAFSYVKYKKEIIGILLRTQKGVKPIWVSPGHLVCLKSIKDIVMILSGKYRMPIPIREAHIFANKIKRDIILTNYIMEGEIERKGK